MDAAVSTVTHWLLYLILFLMSVSGYLLSSASGASVSYFGLLDLPALSRSDALSNAAKAVHLTTQWAVYALVLLHLAGTAWHVVAGATHEISCRFCTEFVGYPARSLSM